MKDAVITIAGFVLLAAVLLSPAACTMHRQVLIADAIAKGGDPIAVKCAIESENSQSPLCMAKAMQTPAK